MTFCTAMFLIKTGERYGIRLYKVSGPRRARNLFQGRYPESKIIKLDIFYGSNPVQHSELPQLGKEDAGLEEGIPASEEAWRYEGSDRAAESPKDVRPKWSGSQWKRHRSQKANQQGGKVNSKKSNTTGSLF